MEIFPINNIVQVVHVFILLQGLNIIHDLGLSVSATSVKNKKKMLMEVQHKVGNLIDAVDAASGITPGYPRMHQLKTGTKPGHDRCALNGVCGLVKITADKQLTYMAKTYDLYTNLKDFNLNVKLIRIDKEFITVHDDEVGMFTTKPVEGTMSLHQLICFKYQYEI